VKLTFGVALSSLVIPTMAAIGTAAILYCSYQLLSHMDLVFNQIEIENIVFDPSFYSNKITKFHCFDFSYL
jgi:hypothetical protein